jgi:isopenicillin N synthase-like dioxygenase
VGFFSITNHGIPQAAIDDVFASAKSFFDLPQATKEDQCPFARHLNSGYEYMTQVTIVVRILL